jgi:uncharacterized phage protein gp47/JayE
MAIRTLTQIVNDAIAYITSTRPDVATFVGSVIRDVVIESPAQEFNKSYQQLLYTQQLQAFVANAATLATTDLDNIGLNYNIPRKQGTQATGTQTLRIRNFTASSATVTVIAGTIVSTLGSTQVSQVQFSTQAQVVFNPALAPSYFNPATGFYEQTVPITALQIGAIGNVAAGTITQLTTSTPGIDAVVNTIPTTGGVDIESNTSYAGRIQVKLSGNNVGTPTGIIELLETNANVQQALEVGPNDPEMQRNQFGGSVDVYILGQTLQAISDTFLYTKAGVQSFVLLHQPAKIVSSVTGLVNGAPVTFIPGVNYNFVLDPTTLFNGSVDLQNRIEFIPSTPVTITGVGGGNTVNVTSAVDVFVGSILVQGVTSSPVTAVNYVTNVITVTSNVGFVAGPAQVTTTPDDGTNFTVNYTYDSLISTLQNLLNQDTEHIATADILVKEALAVPITVNANVSIFPGFDPPTTVSSIQTAVGNYINALGLGASIPMSELITQIQQVAGVDAVVITSTIPIATGPQEIIVIDKTSYATTNAVNITVVV